MARRAQQCSECACLCLLVLSSGFAEWLDFQGDVLQEATPLGLEMWRGRRGCCVLEAVRSVHDFVSFVHVAVLDFASSFRVLPVT